MPSSKMIFAALSVRSSSPSGSTIVLRSLFARAFICSKKALTATPLRLNLLFLLRFCRCYAKAGTKVAQRFIIELARGRAVRNIAKGGIYQGVRYEKERSVRFCSECVRLCAHLPERPLACASTCSSACARKLATQSRARTPAPARRSAARFSLFFYSFL